VLTVIHNFRASYSILRKTG